MEFLKQKQSLKNCNNY